MADHLAVAYWYNPQAEEFGVDPWRLVEGVDPHTHGGSFDVLFANGSFKTVGPLMTFYVSAKDAARLEDIPMPRRRWLKAGEHGCAP